MPRNRLPRVMKHYCTTGRRNHGRHLKRILDTWDRNGSTSDPTAWQIYCDEDIYIYILYTYFNKNQQNGHFLHQCFNLIIVSSTCFEHPSVHPQEDLYMQFCGISFIHSYKQYGRWQYVLDTAIDRTAYMNVWKKYHKTACKSLPEDEYLDVRNMSKTQ